MKAWQFIILLVMAVLCLGLSVATVFTQRENARLQEQLQMRQAQLSSGVLSPQGQQIAGNVLQAMARAATTNEAMRSLLAAHGYVVTPAAVPTQTVSRVTAEPSPKE